MASTPLGAGARRAARAPRRDRAGAGRAVGQHALRTSSAELARHERRRRVDEEVVHVVAALAADLDRVPESGRREQAGPRALALDQRVGGQRGAVDERAHRGGGARPASCSRVTTPSLHGLRRLLRGGQELADADRAGGLVHQTRSVKVPPMSTPIREGLAPAVIR